MKNVENEQMQRMEKQLKMKTCEFFKMSNVICFARKILDDFEGFAVVVFFLTKTFTISMYFRNVFFPKEKQQPIFGDVAFLRESDKFYWL